MTNIQQTISNIIRIYQTEKDPGKRLIMAVYITPLSDQLERMTS